MTNHWMWVSQHFVGTNVANTQLRQLQSEKCESKVINPRKGRWKPVRRCKPLTHHNHQTCQRWMKLILIIMDSSWNILKLYTWIHFNDNGLINYHACLFLFYANKHDCHHYHSYHNANNSHNYHYSHIIIIVISITIHIKWSQWSQPNDRIFSHHIGASINGCSPCSP